MKRLWVLGLVALAMAANGDLLYSNGAVTDGVNNGNGGLNTSQLIPPGSILGLGAQITANNVIADDFTPTADWTIDKVCLFSYQTGAGNIFTFTSANVSIGTSPGASDVGSVVGAPVTNGGFVGYRVAQSSLLDTNRLIYKIEIAVDNWQVSPGTQYWVSYSLAGSFASGPWVAPVVPVLGGGNAQQNVNGAGFIDAVDAGYAPPRVLELPFELHGSRPSTGINVYVTSSDDPATDNAVMSVLASYGHNPTLGLPYWQLDDQQNLPAYEAVYLQPNANWATGDMPEEGQQALLSYVSNGGGLVSCEWTGWKMATGVLTRLSDLLPYVPSGTFDYVASSDFSQSSGDAVMNEGIPAAFSLPLTSWGGTRALPVYLRDGATEFYGMPDIYVGVAGWQYGAGHVVSFATTNGPAQLSQIYGRQLLSNAVNWVAGTSTSASISGTVTLLDYSPTPDTQYLTVMLRQGGVDVDVMPNVVMDSTGAFTINTPLIGQYEIAVKSTHWLTQQYPTSIDITPGGVSGIEFSLTNGDCDGDNEVGIGDYAVLSAAYNSAPGDGNWDPSGDLNGDEAVDIADYAILSANYGLAGD